MSKFMPISHAMRPRRSVAILIWLSVYAFAGIPLSATAPAIAKEGGGDDGGGDHGGDDDGHHGHDDADDDPDSREKASISRFVDMVRSHGGVAEAEQGQGGMRVRYSDGWSEAIIGTRYVLRDRRGSVVLSRPARKADHRRLRALLP